ncbi:MAG: TIGR03009 family protein [Planctomycetaceae bacterium]|jgi:TIGR03009 family protein
MARKSLTRLVFGTAITALFFVNALPVSAQEVAAVQPDPQAAQLDQILTEWHKQSVGIKRLEGEHVRIIYDYVFEVATRAEGKFYYEAPDKGRIDLVPDLKGKGNRFEKINPSTNKKVTLTAQPEQPERWICDGKQVLVIDEVQKSAQQYPLPEEARGNNIMDGPLPFLFGMPPEKAKQRYRMKLLQANAKDVDIIVYPRWKQDLANYKWARIRIERETMLPMAVQMLDPAGSRETVYTFPRIAKNPKKGWIPNFIWKEKDVFKPDLSKYSIQAAEVIPEKVAERRPATAPAGRQLVPAVIGFNFNQAKAILQKSGYTVKMLRGEPATRSELTYRVQKQTPAPKTAVQNGSVVALTLYMPAIEQTGGEVARPVVLPKVLGAHWKDAEKTLKAAGVVLKFRQGRVATNPGDVFKVYDQKPVAGTTVKAGDTVTLTVFITQELADKKQAEKK